MAISAADLHQHPDGGRRRIPDRDFLVLQYPIPALGIELGLVDDQRRAVGERRNDAVGGAGHPAGIGRAPEDVLRVEIEREAAGDVMRNHGLVHVHRALRPSRRAAGEVQQGHVLGAGPYGFKGIRCRGHGGGQVRRARRQAPRAFGQEHLVQARQLLAPRFDLAPIESLGGDEHLGVADRHARLDRLRPECRKQRGEDAPVLERAERGNVELGYATEQREYSIALRHPALRQEIGEAVGLSAQRRVGEIANPVVAPDPPHGKLVAAVGGDVTVDCLMSDIEPASRQTIQHTPRLRPRERPGAFPVVLEVGADVVLGVFSDSFPCHRADPRQVPQFAICEGCPDHRSCSFDARQPCWISRIEGDQSQRHPAAPMIEKQGARHCRAKPTHAGSATFALATSRGRRQERLVGRLTALEQGVSDNSHWIHGGHVNWTSRKVVDFHVIQPLKGSKDIHRFLC